jgi:hypothetical protein
VKLGWSVVLGLIAVGLCSVGTSVGRAQDAAAEAEYQPGTPFAYLFDTGSASLGRLSAQAVAAKTGWTLVPEDTTEHTFQGDAVLLNDKLTVVLRRKGPGAEVYSQTAEGAVLRAVVMAATKTAKAVTGVFSMRIVENNPGAVMVDATFQTNDAGACSAGYRVTTGQAMLEMTAGEAADRLFVWCNARHVVVPDFFGDDMVFGPGTCDLARFALPAESFLLNLLEGGSAMAMCVWRPGKHDAHAILTGEGPERAVRGCEIAGAKEKTLWVALLETPHIWHEQAMSAEHEAGELVLDWRRPFPAKWRADFVRPDGFTESWAFRGPEEDAERAAKVYDNQCCRFDEDRAVVPIPPAAGAASPDAAHPRQIVVYPIDRSPKTPLTAFCPVDALRNTLGVGPCQYILQTEGLASDANPTPDQVMGWIENQFKRKRAKEAAEEIKQRLAQMIDHVRHAEARIQRYADFARDVQALCGPEGSGRDAPDTAETLGRIVAHIEQVVAPSDNAVERPQRAAQLAGQMADLVGKDDALAECTKLGAELRRIGAEQDRALSKCRMAARWLKQQSRMSILRDPRSGELARDVLARVEPLLEGK